MGGMGSGSWIRRDRKTKTGEVYQMDLCSIKKYGALKDGSRGTFSWPIGDDPPTMAFRVESDRLILAYWVKLDDTWQHVEEFVELDRTPCHYGGERLWFLCPTCKKRVAVLYESGGRFICRHCADLSYRSKSGTREDRLRRKAGQIRRRLGASENLSEPILSRPKRMHRKTFERLKREEQAANDEIQQLVSAKLWRLAERFEEMNRRFLS